ncbi:hypothetical protein D3C81_916080 [compost metagenome]
MIILYLLIGYFLIGLLFIWFLEATEGGNFLPTPSLIFIVEVIFWPFIAYGIASDWAEYYWKNRK